MGTFKTIIGVFVILLMPVLFVNASATAETRPVYVIVADNIYSNPDNNVQAALNQWKSDVESLGENTVQIVPWNNLEPGIESATELRDFLKNAYETENLEGAFFIGDIPYVQYDGLLGITDIDKFYRSLYSDWIDYNFDGVLDWWSFRPSLIWVSRLKPSSVVGDPQDITAQVDYINRYFQKNHAYRTHDANHPINSVSQRGLVLSNDGYASNGADYLNMVYQDVEGLYEEQTTETNIKEKLDPQGQGFETLMIGAHGGQLFADGYMFNPSEILEFEPKTLYVNFGSACAAARYNGNTVAQAYVFAPTFGLVATGPTTSGGGPGGENLFEPIKQGFSIGDAILEYELKNMDISEGINTAIGSGIGLIGDPLLKFPSEQWLSEGHALPMTPPTPSGGPEGEGFENTFYAFNFGPVDENNVSYFIDWGDGQKTQVDNVASGETVSRNHLYKTTGKYVVRYRSIAQDGTFSKWSDIMYVNINLSENPILSLDIPDLDFEIKEGQNINPQIVTLSNTGNFLLNFQLIEIFSNLNELKNYPFGGDGLFEFAGENSDRNLIVKGNGDTSIVYYNVIHTGMGETQLILFYQEFYADSREWAEPIAIYDYTESYQFPHPHIPVIRNVSMDRDKEGKLYIFFNLDTALGDRSFYREYDEKMDQWNPPLGEEPFLLPNNANTVSVRADAEGRAHLLLGKNYLNSQDSFTSPQHLFASSGNRILVDSNDNLHVFLGNLLHWIKYKNTDQWIALDDVPYYDVKADRLGNVYSISRTDDSHVDVRKWQQGQSNFSSLGMFLFNYSDLHYNDSPNLIFDSYDNLYVLYNEKDQTDQSFMKIRKYNENNNEWSEPLLYLDSGGQFDADSDSLGNVRVVGLDGGCFNAFSAKLTGEKWYQANQLEGTLAPGQQQEITISFNTENLTPGEYKATLLARVSYDSENSFKIPIRVKVLSTTPAAPEYVKTVTSEVSNALYWHSVTQADDGSDLDDLVGYKIYRAISGSGNYAILTQVADNVTEYSDSTLNPGETYDYQVTAIDAEGHESLPTEATALVCADVDGSGDINVSDVSYLTTYLFANGPAPEPLFMADQNADETINVADLTYLVGYLFQGGPVPMCSSSAVLSNNPTGDMTLDQVEAMVTDAQTAEPVGAEPTAIEKDVSEPESGINEIPVKTAESITSIRTK